MAKENTASTADTPSNVATLEQPSVSQKALAVMDEALARIGYNVAKVVNRPLLKHEENQVRMIKITGPVFVGKELKGTTKEGEAKMAPAMLAPVIDLETGREHDYIIGAVFNGVLEDSYPDASYVGKCFAVNKLPAEKGKRYKPVEVLELAEAK